MKKILFLLSKKSRFNKIIQKNMRAYEEFSGNEFKIIKSYNDDIKIVINNSPGFNIKMEIDGQDIQTFNLVYFKNWEKNLAVVCAMGYFLKLKQKKFFNDNLLGMNFGNKLLPTVFAASEGILVPKTVYFSSNLIKQNIKFLVEFLGFPFIMKSLNSKLGQGVFMIRSLGQVEVIKKKYRNDEFIFQEFIENEYTLRVITLDYKVSSAKSRAVKESSTRDFNSLGIAEKEKVIPLEKLPLQIIKASEKIAKFKKANISGLDYLIRKKDHKAFFIELNFSPGLNLVTDQGQRFSEFLLKSCQ